MVAAPAASAAATNLQQVVTASLEAISKAALSESQAVSIELARESLAEQKRGGAASQASLNALSSRMDTLSSKQDSLVMLAWAQTLQLAIQSVGNFPSENFQYINASGSTGSETLMKGFLLTFFRNLGAWISNDYHIGTKDDAGREAFRTKLSNHIHVLTGCKPRLAKEMNGKVEQWAIYRE